MTDKNEEEINTSGVAFLVALLVTFVSLLCFHISLSKASDQILDSGSKSKDSQGVTFNENSNEGRKMQCRNTT